MTAENHPQLSWSTCTAPGQCQAQAGKVTIDANWRWTHMKGETTNCYTGNTWNTTICPDAQTCSQNCVGVCRCSATYGVHTNGDELQLDFVTEGEYSTNVGSRTFLLMRDDTPTTTSSLTMWMTLNWTEASIARCTLCRWMLTMEAAARRLISGRQTRWPLLSR